MKRSSPFAALRRARLAALLAAAALTPTASADAQVQLPIQPPERPFLLVDAPRRYAPDEDATLRIQLRGGGRVRASLFRVRRPREVLELAGARQGTSVARLPLGAEAEQLVAASGALPRRSERLELVSDRTVAMPGPGDARRVFDETIVYDSNETQEDDVATYWVRAGGWSVKEHSFGRLAPGLYLARIHAGPWATTAILSVGARVLQVRRGDVDDVVLVTDADGAPLEGAEVRAEVNGRAVATARTSRTGEARLPAEDAVVVRYLSSAGDDIAWADVSHARLAPCDPRVYVATGRPFFRVGERFHVRGHVRACDRTGRYVGLPDETVQLGIGDSRATARTDRDGNFVAELVAGYGELVATHRGREHIREIRIDSRVLPRRSLAVTVDRGFAKAGDVLTVRVADDEGGWPEPAEVVLTTPAGRLVGRVGPGAPAIFHVPVPATESTLARFAMSASVSTGLAMTLASTEIWIGKHDTVLEVTSPAVRGSEGDPIALTVSAKGLDGAPSRGEVTLSLFGSDGNRRRGSARSTHRVAVGRDGTTRLDLALVGAGPWLVEAHRGEARAELVVWERERPPQLSPRGPLAVVPAKDRTEPGATLEVTVRVPRGQRAWVTLEQGNVWASRVLPRGAPVRTVRLRVPDRARGAAKVVVSHVGRSEVSVASAAVEVATSQILSVTTQTERAIYSEGESAHVVLEAKLPDGSPSDGVASVWMADAGYWDLGADEYPLPGEYLARPGRMASAGDSTHPLGYGAEEGRVLPDAHMKWNGELVSGTTYRHAWGSYGRLVRVRAEGSLLEVVRALARAAGLEDARVCPETVRTAGRVTLEAHDLPYDLVAATIAEITETDPTADRRILELACGGYGGIGLGGMGSGGGGSGFGSGMGAMGATRAERLEGTLFFAGLVRLGEDGRAELDIPLPSQPGRFRIESLVIADDGGGARAHAIVHTRRAVEAWLDVPPSLRPGDVATGSVSVRAPAHAGRTVELSLALPAAIELVRPIPERATLDANGTATVSVELRARAQGSGRVELRAAVRGASAAASDAVHGRVEVLPPFDEREIDLRALVGPGATAVHLALPELSSPATLTVEVDPDLAPTIERAFDELREPRWHIPAMRIDRLASLASLARAARGASGPDSEVATRIDHARASEAARLAEHIPPGGGVGWWSGLAPDGGLTAEALLALEGTGPLAFRRDAITDLRRAADENRLGSGRTAAIAARVFASRTNDQSDPPRARTLASTVLATSSPDLEMLAHVALAARALADPRLEADAAQRLEATLDRLLSRDPADGTGAPCRGPIWFLCYMRIGERGIAAMAANALLTLDRPRARARAARVVTWLGASGPVETRFAWGSSAADELELAARVLPSRGERTSFTAFTGERRIALRGSEIVLPAGSSSLDLRFAARQGRAVALRIRGTVSTPAPARPEGTATLERRFSSAGGTSQLSVAIELHERARGTAIRVPLPAGLALAGPPEIPEGGRAAAEDGAFVVRFDELSAGRVAFDVPLHRIAPGTFTAGPAELASEDRAWARTPSAQVTVQ